MRYIFRPLGPWTEGETTRRRSRYAFKASWTDTLRLLEHELAQLRADNVVLQADFVESDLRLDGMPRSNARQPMHPGVRVAFDSKHGPLTYATDAYEFWQHNIRAIALGLEALRAVDRYGVTRRGEQYTGWKALPTGTGAAPSHMTREAAAALLERVAVGEEGDSRDREIVRILSNREHAIDVWRHARPMAHPDRRQGDQTLWDQVEQAARVLGLES